MKTNTTKIDNILLQLPTWLTTVVAEQSDTLPTPEARMHFVIQLARLNIEHKTGGPFAAAIFNMETQALISAGVNLVIPSNCSMAHAEMIAISLAQKQLNHYDLGAPDLPRFELVSSSEPCAMCFGALPWSGIRHLSCGADDMDARAIGFDEGPRHPDWVKALNERGISVDTGICKTEAKEILQTYAKKGIIYNARQG